MSECSAYVPKRFDKMKRKYYYVKYAAYMAIHAAWWRLLWITRLARPYSKTLCRFNLYRKFPDGRCHWCGKIH